MSRVPLQQFEHDRSSYERPNSEWVCGRASCGKPCALGPDHKGGCHTTSECVPTRQGDRWVCARPGALGGKCSPGPRPDGSCCRPIVPCTPVRSLRRVRGSIVRWTTIVTVGFVLVLLGLEKSGEVFSPGDLASAHAKLATRDIMTTGASQCSACHADSSSTVAQIIRTDNDPNAASGVGPVLSEKCLECHPMGAHAMKAHALGPDELQELTSAVAEARSDPTPGVSLARSIDAGVHALHHAGEAIDCVTCHSEHHGRDADIALLTEEQCQTCHSQPFGAFEGGHPEFTDYPYDTPAQISFNHAAHIRTHFKSPEHADKNFACMTCHVTDERGGAMLVRGYENSCMECHEGQIAGAGRSGVQGVPFFTLPALDTRTLEEEDVWIGAWPADDIYTGGATPFMRLMMANDPDVLEALERTDEKSLRELYTLEGDERAHAIEDAQTIAWGVKRLVRDVLAGGQGTVVKRVESALGRTLGADERGRLLAGLPVSAMVSARDAWFPELHVELAMHDAGVRPQPEIEDQPAETAAQGEGTEDFQPSEIDLGTGDDIDLLGGGDDDLLGGGDDDDLLNADDSGDNLLDGGDDDLLGGGDDDLLGAGGDDDLLGNLDDDLLGPGGDDEPRQPTFDDIDFSIPDAQEWVSNGGWFVYDGVSMSIVYRPAGHADGFVRAWLDLCVGAATPSEPNISSASHDSITDVFAQLSDRSAPGVCMKCHIADTDPVLGDPVVHWEALARDDEHTRFTRFAHGPHLTDLGDNACFACHEVAPVPTVGKEREQTCFAPLSIEDCQECHNSNNVDTSCLGCHNYHVGVRSFRAWGGSLDALPDEGEDEQGDASAMLPPRPERFWHIRSLASER